MASDQPCGYGDSDPQPLPGSLDSGLKVGLRGKSETLSVDFL